LIQGGVNLKVVESNAMPYSVWGKVKKSLLGWNVAARVDTDSSDLNQMAVDLQLSGGPAGTAIQLKGSANAADRSGSVSSVKVTQKVDGLGGSWTVAPRYNLDSGKGDVKVAYGIAGATVTVDAAGDSQKVTVSKQFGEKNRIAPSISTQGDVELEYSRSIASGSLTTTIKPNKSVNVNWQDGSWAVNLNAPVEGIEFKKGAKVSVSCSGI
jgi:hypothetical protein